MSGQNWSYQDLRSKRSRQGDQSCTCRADSRCQSRQSVLAPRTCTLPRWPVFLLIAIIAVIGEFAAFAIASALRLGTTATTIALAGVALSAMWPLLRSAI